MAKLITKRRHPLLLIWARVNLSLSFCFSSLVVCLFFLFSFCPTSSFSTSSSPAPELSNGEIDYKATSSFASHLRKSESLSAYFFPCLSVFFLRSPTSSFSSSSSPAPELSNGEIDYKATSSFASHLSKSEAVSDFAKSKSLLQQRQYLPIYACREELLQVVRDNAGMERKEGQWRKQEQRGKMMKRSKGAKNKW